MADKSTLVIFASDQGPGDAERTPIMSQTGKLLASKDVKLVFLVENGVVPMAILKSSFSRGAEVELICDGGCDLPGGLKEVNQRTISDQSARYAALAEMADCFVILPGSLDTAISHFQTIKELGAKIPMVFLNQNKAFEIVRGFSNDVFAHTFPTAHKNLQFAEDVDDIWAKVSKVLSS